MREGCRVQWTTRVVGSDRRCLGDHQHFPEQRIDGKQGAVDRSGAGTSGARFRNLVLCGPQDEQRLADRDFPRRDRGFASAPRFIGGMRDG